MFKRLICAIIGHTEWRGMGAIGSVSFGDFVHKQECVRCGIVVYSVEPKWHRRGQFDTRVRASDLPRIPPHKHTLQDSDYEEQLTAFNRDYPIGVLADVHETTEEKLRELGYR